MTIKLASGATEARIAPEGAELKAWSVAGRSLLWDPDPAVWDETAPLLFPVVGWTKNHQARVGGTIYPLGLHGFARHRQFTILEQRRDYARMALASDAATRALFPFDFMLIAEYHVSEAMISAALTVQNVGDGPMPYACGLHPGFRWPFAGGAPEEYCLRFAESENPSVPRIAPGGLISATKRCLPLQDQVLRLAAELFDNDALCFLNAASSSLRFEAPNGAAIVVESENFAHWGIWCRPSNGYLCIEEWTGYSDPEDFVGDLFAKPSMQVLPPGEKRRHAARFAYEASADALAETRKTDR